jgi:hypothetical protein
MGFVIFEGRRRMLAQGKTASGAPCRSEIYNFAQLCNCQGLRDAL